MGVGCRRSKRCSNWTPKAAGCPLQFQRAQLPKIAAVVKTTEDEACLGRWSVAGSQSDVRREPVTFEVRALRQKMPNSARAKGVMMNRGTIRAKRERRLSTGREVTWRRTLTQSRLHSKTATPTGPQHSNSNKGRNEQVTNKHASKP